MKNLFDKIYSIQIVLFFSEDSVFKTVNAAANLGNIFSKIFPEEPNLIPYDQNQPKELPRCIFQKNDGGTSLILCGDRLQFRSGIISDANYQNDITVLANLMDVSCKTSGINVKRIGIVIEASGNTDTEKILSERVNIDSYKESNEKSTSWVIQKKIDHKLELNVWTNILINKNDALNPHRILLDVNTSPLCNINQLDKEFKDVIADILNEIEVKKQNVFE